MPAFAQVVEILKQLVVWWLVVEPWERAVRVRAGKRVTLLGEGVHFRIPFVDVVYIHNTRRMVSYLSAQTISSLDGKVYSVSASISYEIADVLKLHMSAHHAHDVVMQRAAQAVSEFITDRNSKDISPAAIRALVSGIDLSCFGIANTEVCINNFAIVKTYRLINESMTGWGADGCLSTQRKA